MLLLRRSCRLVSHGSTKSNASSFGSMMRNGRRMWAHSATASTSYLQSLNHRISSSTSDSSTAESSNNHIYNNQKDELDLADLRLAMGTFGPSVPKNYASGGSLLAVPSRNIFVPAPEEVTQDPSDILYHHEESHQLQQEQEEIRPDELPSGTDGNVIDLSSVLKKRRKKMRKHKDRKRWKKTRTQRRKRTQTKRQLRIERERDDPKADYLPF